MSRTKTLSTEDRFWAKVNRLGADECWEWTGAKMRRGYGGMMFSKDGKRSNKGAHRVSWTIHHGEIPAGLNVLHKCDNPPCVNPNHLFLGTLSDNIVDCYRKGRRVGYGRIKWTACGKGHPYPENPRRHRDGSRICEICKRAAYDARNARRSRADAIRPTGSSS